MQNPIFLDAETLPVLPCNNQIRNPESRYLVLTCIIASVLCGFALFIELHVRRLDLNVPLTYWGDALYFLSWTKNILAGNWPWFHPRLGAPFGADWRDFPSNLTIEALLIRFASLFTLSPGLVLNLIWMFGTSVCAGFATFSLIRVGVQGLIAVGLGVLYALQPFSFYRGIAHFDLLFYLVPLLALGTVEIAAAFETTSSSGDTKVQPHSLLQRCLHSLASVPGYLYFACVAQGLSYIYNSFFAVVLFVVAGFLGYATAFRRRAVVPALLAIAVLCCTTSINLLPDIFFWATNGKDAAMAYKSPVEAEVYGLKLRHLLTPIPNNPLPPLRYIQQKLDGAGFTGEYENATSRLGTIGSLGLLFLLAWALTASMRTPIFDGGPAARVMGACSALTLACILLATTGGFGTVFNVFVAPDVRCYNRIVVFIEFFCFVAVGLLMTRGLTLITNKTALAIVSVTLCALLIRFGVSDEAVTLLYNDRSSREQQFNLDRSFTRSLESELPKNSMLFQLPFTDFPLDGGRNKMLPYDHSRAYIHSSTLRWSWGGISGRASAEWASKTSNLPVNEMLARLAASGFAGIWIDRFGYAPNTSPEPEIAAITHERPLERPDGRIAYFSLSSYKDDRSTSNRATDKTAAARIEMTFPVGFYAEEHDQHRHWRWCKRHGVIELHNALNRPRTVTMEMMLQTGSSRPRVIQISASGRSDRVGVSIRGKEYHRTVRLSPDQTLTLSVDCDCTPLNAPGDTRLLYFGLIDPTLEERP